MLAFRHFKDFVDERKCESNRPVTGRPHAGAGIGAKAPSPGDHKGRPYYATASHAGAGIGAKERFFPFTLFPGEYHLS